MEFDDAEWQSVKGGAMGNHVGTTAYIRREVQIPSLEDYHVLNVRVKYTGGVAVYFNGRVVARFNLAEGFDASTEAQTVRAVPGDGGSDRGHKRVEIHDGFVEGWKVQLHSEEVGSGGGNQRCRKDDAVIHGRIVSAGGRGGRRGGSTAHVVAEHLLPVHVGDDAVAIVEAHLVGRHSVNAREGLAEVLRTSR